MHIQSDDIWTLRVTAGAANSTVYTTPNNAAYATVNALLTAYPDALIRPKGYMHFTLGTGTGTGSVVDIDIHGRMSDADSFASVLAAALDESDKGTYVEFDVYPQMKFIVTDLDADGGTGLSVRFTYPTAKARTIPVGTLAANRTENNADIDL